MSSTPSRLAVHLKNRNKHRFFYIFIQVLKAPRFSQCQLKTLMEEKQELRIDGLRYPVYRYRGSFERDLETKKLSMSMALCIPTENIAPISPWFVEQKNKKEITIVRHLSKKGKPFKKVCLDFIGVRCTQYSEEYDEARKEVVLHLMATFDYRVTTNDRQQEKITDLLT